MEHGDLKSQQAGSLGSGIFTMLIILDTVHDPAQRPSLRQLEHLIMGNLRIYQNEGYRNTEGRTSIRDILTTPPPPSSSSTLAGIARDAPMRWTNSGGWGAYDAEGNPGGPSRTRQRGRNALRRARNVFGGGGRLQYMARRAGRSIRRVFLGAVSRVTRVTGGLRQTRLGNATVDRPEEQQVGRRQVSVGEVQRGMASLGFYPAP